MFKTYIKRMLESALDGFRMPDEEARAFHHQLANYDAQAKSMRDRRSSDILPIGSEEAMDLIAAVFAEKVSGFDSLYCTTVYERYPHSDMYRVFPRFAAYGETSEQAKARAAQLVSALDGARRL